MPAHALTLRIGDMLELQPDGHYQLATPLRVQPVGHRNIAVPPGYARLMPLRKMPIAGKRVSHGRRA